MTATIEAIGSIIYYACALGMLVVLVRLLKSEE